MAHAYTPGLKVVEHTRIRKERRLPLRGEVVYEVGSQVKAEDVIARTSLPGKVYPVNLANALGVSPEGLESLMIVGAGGSVEQGGLLAESGGFFGLFKSAYHSPVAGTVESISRVTGQVILQAEPIPVEVNAYINGEVTELFPEEGVVVEADGAFVQGIFGLGGEVYAPLMALATDPSQPIGPQDINESHRGKIIIGGGFFTLEAMKRAIALGVTGVVTGGFDFQDVSRLLGYEVGVAITGTERMGTTLMLTEGFGHIGMAHQTFDLLNRNTGRYASLNGATQIRAGVIRPEIIVTHDDDTPRPEATIPEVRGTDVGDQIRCIRAPYFGRIGTVLELPVELRTMESETRVRTMVVEFEGGERAVLPRSNVEMIEG